MHWHAEAYARQIFEKPYPDREQIVLQARRAKELQTAEEFTARELASFASAFDKALKGMGQVDAVKLLQRSLQEAERSHRIKPRTTRGRYWCYWFGKHMADHRRRHEERSGPPDGGGGAGKGEARVLQENEFQKNSIAGSQVKMMNTVSKKGKSDTGPVGWFGRSMVRFGHGI